MIDYDKVSVHTWTGEQKATPDGERREWVSDKWQYINKKGELI